MRAVWKDELIAESDDTVVVDGNHYFPPESVVEGRLRESDTTTVCSWKGTASYFSVVVGDEVNPDAAWTYPDPKQAAEEIRGRIAFWRGVRVEA
jgi:uncharacterized protein (DUF427 family)